jgi:hypothetical protein
MPLRVSKWVTHAPLAILPLLAALFVQRPLAGRGDAGFNLESYALLLQHHWFWLVVTLGLGIWVGWHTAVDRAFYAEPDETPGAP